MFPTGLFINKCQMSFHLQILSNIVVWIPKGQELWKQIAMIGALFSRTQSYTEHSVKISHFQKQIYLFILKAELQREREGKREREKVESQDGPHMWLQGPKHLDHLSLLPEYIGRKLDLKWNSQDSTPCSDRIPAPKVASSLTMPQHRVCRYL